MLNCRRSTQPHNRFRFTRSHRLTAGDDIRRVATQGKRIRTAHLELRILASPVHHPRIGVIVPMYGHTAVERNQLKRRLREIVRIYILAQLPPIDFLIRTRPSAYGVAFSILADELTSGAAKSCELSL